MMEYGEAGNIFRIVDLQVRRVSKPGFYDEYPFLGVRHVY